MPTSIEWATEIWNPITGCTRISPGCKNCYAERMAKCLAGRYGYDKHNPFRPATIHHGPPPRRKKPMMVFVCSMGDLFHDAVDFESIELVLDDISKSDKDLMHRWLFLTKRPRRMLKFSKWMYGDDGAEWPRNVWLGVTCENQEAADSRIPILMEIPAAVRFVSVEPMLGPVDLDYYLGNQKLWNQDQIEYADIAHQYSNCELPRLDWVICGGGGCTSMENTWLLLIKPQNTNNQKLLYG